MLVPASDLLGHLVLGEFPSHCGMELHVDIWPNTWQRVRALLPVAFVINFVITQNY